VPVADPRPVRRNVPEVTPTLIPLGTLTDPDTGDQWTVVVKLGRRVAEHDVHDP